MKKDRITSVILIFLVISSVALTVKIWFSEELWPYGYNFFVAKDNILSCIPFVNNKADQEDAVAPLHETMFMPEKIIVNRSGIQRTIYSGKSDDFIFLNNLTKKVLHNLFSSESERTEVSRIEYYDTVRSHSVLVEYPVSLPVRVVGHMCEVNDSKVFSDISSVKDFALLPDGETGNGVLVFMRDSENNTVYKYKIDFDGSSLENDISHYAGSSRNYMSAYELGFYKRDSEDKIDIARKVVFEPFVFIDTSKEVTQSECIRGKNPFDNTEPSDLSLEAINGVVSAFGYNPNTIRRYIDSDGTLVFVQDYSTIKLYRTGMLEYTTTTPKKGIKMQIHSESADSPQNVLDTIDSITEILGGVWKSLDMGDMPDIRLSSDVTDNYTHYSMEFDYRYNGIPIIFNSGAVRHAVELEIRNNLLVSLKTYIRGYIPAGAYSDNISTLDALDRFYEELNVSSEANDLFLGYIDYGTTGRIYTHWNIRQDNGTTFSIRR